MRDVTPDELGGLSKTAVVIGPFGSSLKTSDFTDSGVPLIFVRDIRAGDFSKPRAFVSEEKARELRAHIAIPGDLVVTKMGDPPGDVAIYDGPVPALITADCIRLRPTRGYDTRYLLHAFKTPRVRQQVLDITSGAAQKKVSLERFRHRVAVPVPSLPEQRHIAAILDHVDTLRAKRRQVLAHLAVLTQSIFNDMVGAEAWATTLGDLAEVQIGPFGSLLHQEDYVSGGVAVINPMHIRGGVLEPDPEFSVSEEKASTLSLYRLRSGDVVLGRRGEMGRAGIASEEHAGMLCGTGSIILRPREVDSRFLHAVVTSPRMKGHLVRSALGATLPNLNAGIVKAAPAPKPRAEVQATFAESLAKVERCVADLVRASSADAKLFTSLQSRAFRGEL
jgi:type I restriction enzyme S subunit